MVEDTDDVIIISSDGIVIRIAADTVSSLSRTSRGVKVMRVSEGEHVVSATAIQNEEELGRTDEASDADEEIE